MIKLAISIFISALVLSGNAHALPGKACPLLFVSTPIRVLNVFYDGRNSEFAVNTVDKDQQTDFLRTRQIVFNSSRVEGCEAGCLANIRAESETTFAVLVGDRKIVSIFTKDPDSLLPSSAFSVINESGKIRLTLNVDVLSAVVDSATKVTFR